MKLGTQLGALFSIPRSVGALYMSAQSSGLQRRAVIDVIDRPYT